MSVFQLTASYVSLVLSLCYACLQVNLCGHATLAAAHFLFTSRLVNANLIEFITLSGVLTARKVMQGNKSDALKYENGEAQEHFSVELDFPIVPMVEYNSAEVASISKALNGASVIDIKKTEEDDLFVFSRILYSSFSVHISHVAEKDNFFTASCGVLCWFRLCYRLGRPLWI